MVKLLFLGKFSDLAPAASHEVTLPDEVRTLADLKVWVAHREPGLGQAMEKTPTRLAVNQCLAPDLSQPIADGDEIAFLPPMSGG